MNAREDVLPLARTFWRPPRALSGRPLKLSSAAEQALLAHHWLDNVRELESVV